METGISQCETSNLVQWDSRAPLLALQLATSSPTWHKQLHGTCPPLCYFLSQVRWRSEGFPATAILRHQTTHTYINA